MILNFTEQGSGSPIILMHGMFGSLSNLGNLARSLNKSHRVISVDLRNHGDSPHDLVFDLSTMASDIVELMDFLSLPSANLVGHSLGGKVGMQVALNFPNRVKNLVVADISPVAYKPKNDAALDGLIALSNAKIDSRKHAEKILSHYVSDNLTRAFLLKNLQLRDDNLYELKINMKAVSENYLTNLVAAPFGNAFSGPCLFLKGEKSAYIQTKHRPMIEAFFPESQIVTLPGVGHWLHAESPKMFNKLITDFLIN